MMLTSCERIVHTRDMSYVGPDRHNFIRCCFCQCYTPFIFYVISKKALDMVATTLPPHHNFFCVNCLPKPPSTGSDAGELYTSGSLFNNQEFLSMFQGYEYFNPYYHKIAKTNCLIITELCGIYSDFKTIARKPLPLAIKMRKLYNLFPPVHQIEFRRYASMSEMFTELRKKYKAISAAYNTSSNRPLYDNYDMIVERTPSFQSQTARNSSRDSRSQANLFPTDTLMRAQRSDQSNAESGSDADDADTMQFSSQSLNDEQEHQLQLPDSMQSAMQSIDISSQEVEIESSAPLSESIESMLPNVSIASSGSSTPMTRIRPLQGVSNSQEAGPSGLQQQTARDPPLQAKRRRVSSTPTNPTPEEAQSSRGSRLRLPRLAGG